MAAQLSDYDLEDLGRLLADASETHFSAQLVRLIKSANKENRRRMTVAFPEHVRAVRLWEDNAGKPMWRCGACGTINVEDGFGRRGQCDRCSGR